MNRRSMHRSGRTLGPTTYPFQPGYGSRMGNDPLESILAIDPGEAFEEMCWNLLRRRYRPEQLVYLPATLEGDYGIEGFSKDGIVYQCYADRDSLSLRDRTTKQKRKLYKDTVKLKSNATKLEAVLDGLVIEGYIFMVPQFDAAELVAYAVKRAEAVRSLNLKFIASNFSISIKEPKDYPEELRAAERDGSATAVVPDPLVESKDVELFQTRKPELVAKLEKKLAALEIEEGRTELRDDFVRAFLVKEGVMGGLEEWPETWEAVERRRRLREEKLSLENQLDSTAPKERVGNLITGYQDDLFKAVGGLGEPDAQRVAMGQVGDWLMRCPLRFPSSSS